MDYEGWEGRKGRGREDIEGRIVERKRRRWVGVEVNFFLFYLVLFG